MVSRSDAVRTVERKQRELREYLAQRDVPCPGCTYNLRGLDGLSCPECGYGLDPVLLRAGQARAPRPKTPELFYYPIRYLLVTVGLWFVCNLLLQQPPLWFGRRKEQWLFHAAVGITVLCIMTSKPALDYVRAYRWTQTHEETRILWFQWCCFTIVACMLATGLFFAIPI